MEKSSMLVSELFESREKEKKLDNKQLRKDYIKWKRLINMPTPLVKAMIQDKTVTRTMSAGELRKKYGFTIPNNMAKAILKMRNIPFKNWSTVEMNWMHRMLRYILAKTSNTRPFVTDGKATDKLKDLWSYGHIPNNFKPGRILK